MPDRIQRPSTLPARLDEAARRDIQEAQKAMRELIARMPRDFGYADEIDLVFDPAHGR